MGIKKTNKKKLDLNNIQSLMTKNLSLKKLNIKPADIIENTKNKIGNLYSNYKKEREKEKKRLDKKRKNDEKKELQKQIKQSQKDRLEKVKEEKRQILAQKKMILDNEKQACIN